MTLLIALLGCVEYHPTGKPDREDTGGTPPAEVPSPGPLVVLPEVCNGLDDDRDGLRDEGFGDVDGDGQADCVDRACVPVLTDGAGPVPACGAARSVVPDPWDLELVDDLAGEGSDACTAVAVADLDGDGAPELVCGGWGGLRAYAWDRSGPIATWPDFDPEARVAFAVVEGEPTLFGFDEDGFVRAGNADGSTRWVSGDAMGAIRATTQEGTTLVVSDINGDGIPEVVTARGAISALDGHTVRFFDYNETNIGALTVEVAAADLDGDGAQEVIFEFSAWNSDGTIRWNHYPPDTASWWGIVNTLVVQADADHDGEVVYLSEVSMMVVDTDGTVLRDTPTGVDLLGFISIACAADVTGDGVSEVFVGDGSTFRAYRLDGSVLWEAPYDDPSSITVCTVSDIDANGVPEILMDDESTVWILDGATGTPLFQDDTWDSMTIDDNVFPVDLDGDGSMELVVTGTGGGFTAGDAILRVYAPRARNWYGGASFWPNEVWSGTALQADGTVPRTPHRAWLDGGRYRAAPDTLTSGANLAPVVTETCVASCDPDGQVHVGVGLVNAGPDERVDPLPVAVYTADGALLTVFWTSDWLDDGATSPTFDLLTDTRTATDGLLFVAGDDGTTTTPDCRPDDDRLSWRLTDCDP